MKMEYWMMAKSRTINLYVEYTENGVERKFPYCDYQFIPKTPWNYGYAGDEFEVTAENISLPAPISDHTTKSFAYIKSVINKHLI